MAGSHLITQLVKQIENAYKERSVIEHQIEQLKNQRQAICERILAFEKTLYYIEPTFDLRKIRTQFNGARLLKQKLFNSEISYLIAKVLNEEQDWRNIYAITSSAIRLDEQRSGSETREHYAVIANALRRLTKKGIIEMRKYEPHKLTKSRAFFRRHEWRLKPIEQG